MVDLNCEMCHKVIECRGGEMWKLGDSTLKLDLARWMNLARLLRMASVL